MQTNSAQIWMWVSALKIHIDGWRCIRWGREKSKCKYTKKESEIQLRKQSIPGYSLKYRAVGNIPGYDRKKKQITVNPRNLDCFMQTIISKSNNILNIQLCQLVCCHQCSHCLHFKSIYNLLFAASIVKLSFPSPLTMVVVFNIWNFKQDQFNL